MDCWVVQKEERGRREMEGRREYQRPKGRKGEREKGRGEVKAKFLSEVYNKCIVVQKITRLGCLGGSIS